MPVDFADLLVKANPKALEVYYNFNPSHKQGIFGMDSGCQNLDATRQKRMQTAIEQIAEKKSRHWKYQAP